MKSDHSAKWSSRFLQKLFATLSISSSRKPNEPMHYDDIFKGTTIVPLALSGAVGNFFPGITPRASATDTYFKEVFAGPVF